MAVVLSTFQQLPRQVSSSSDPRTVVGSA